MEDVHCRGEEDRKKGKEKIRKEVDEENKEERERKMERMKSCYIKYVIKEKKGKMMDECESVVRMILRYINKCEL